VALDAIPKRALQVKIAALAPFPFVGSEFGGGERIYNLLTSVEHEIEVFTPNYGPSQQLKHKNLNINYIEVPEELRVGEFDLVVVRESERMFKKLLADYKADLVILEHPWQVDALSGQRFLYDAHNNETELKKVLSDDEAVSVASRVEALALQADHVTYCSTSDKIDTNSPSTYIPNGTDLPELNIRLGRTSRTLLFVGSAHPPNVGAALTLASLAPALSDYQIVIAGECSRYVKNEAGNVSLLGHVSKEVLDYLMRTSHAFINPIAAGSGTSLKVGRALSYGLPVLSSEIGARGYKAGCLIVKNAQDLFDALDDMQNEATYNRLSDKALEVAQPFSWKKVGADFNSVVQGMLYDNN
jgi:glycosyltransferase involved in cell wall biosynthesis